MSTLNGFSSEDKTPEDIIDELQNIVDQMRSGDFTHSKEVILLARDDESDIVTVCRLGKHTGLLKEAWDLTRPEA